MAEKTTSSNVTHLRAVADKTASGPKSLEERLEEARAKRARILAAKGSNDARPKGPTKPWLEAGQIATEDDEFDPAARAASLQHLADEPLVVATDDPEPAPPPKPDTPRMVPDEPVPEAPAADAAASAPVPVPAPRSEHRIVRAGLLGLVAGLALVAGAAVTNIDRLPDIVATVAAPPPPAEIAMSRAPVPKTYLAWDPIVLRPAMDRVPSFGPPDHLAPLALGPSPTLPERGIEIPLAARLAIGAATLDIPPRFDARVRLFAPAGLAQSDITRVTDFLSGQKLQLGALTPVSFRVEGNEVRYFHPDDRATAQALARLLGASLRQYPYNRDDPAEPGILEIWIAGG